jgi:hypothetical protein
MYIFSFELFDDFEFLFLFFWKIINTFKIENLHIAKKSYCKHEKVSIKNTLYFSRTKKDKFGTISESLDWSRWMENVGQMGGPVTT